MLAADIAVVDRLDRPALIFLDAAALTHPFDPRARKPLLHVDDRVRIGIGPGRVVDRQRRLARAFRQRDLTQRHAQVGRGFRHRVNLRRSRQRPGGHLRRGDVRIVDVHFLAPREGC
jgi:hypothetical protein